MVRGTVEARLTSRLLLVVGAALVVVAAAAVAVTGEVLEASDTASARALALGVRDELRRELHEGDSLHDALDEVLVGGANGSAVRVTARASEEQVRALGEPLPPIASGSCVTLVDAAGGPWRACEASEGPVSLVVAVSTARHRAVVAALARGMLGVVGVALLALWFAVRGAVRGPVGELARLVEWTGQIVEAGEPKPPPAATTREVAHLASAFEGLVRRLLDALARERASSAHIAHELRTPLAALRAELDTLPAHALGARRSKPDGLRRDVSRRGTASPPLESAVARMRSDVTRLADVIDAILVLSSSSSGPPSECVVNVADVVRELAGGRAAVRVPDEALVAADESLVRLALRNLIENAEKYGGGVVAVAVAREEGATIRCTVTDGGPGIAEEGLARMFDRYWRGSADGEGRGLGLALVKAVAERHGGTVRAERGPLGNGLRVSMTLGRLLGWHDGERGPG